MASHMLNPLRTFLCQQQRSHFETGLLVTDVKGAKLRFSAAAGRSHFKTGVVDIDVMGAMSGSTGGSNPLDKKNGTRKRTGTSANKM